MQESLYVTGIVLKQTPFGEYDRIVSLLTREKGKITAFARGARKPGNRLAAATNPFAFGTFRLYEGRTSYTISEADIQNFFPELLTDMACTLRKWRTFIAEKITMNGRC
mgnify:CR=1 FL=1